jgi:NitT/TauT family transport system permease protein
MKLAGLKTMSMPDLLPGQRKGQMRRSPYDRGRRPSTFWRLRGEIPGRLRRSLIVVSLVAPLLIWTLLYATQLVSPIHLPSPISVLQRLWDLLTNGQIWSAASISMQRVALGFGLAIVVSVPLGLAMGSFRSMQSLFEPVISFFRYMPATAFMPLLLIWFGLGEEPKLALIFIGSVFFNTLMTANIVWTVPHELLKVSYTLGASSFTVFRKVIFPFAVPGVIDAIRVNLAAAWNLIIVAELLAASEGIGVRIVRAQKFLQTDTIFVYLIVIGLIGVATDMSLRIARRRLAGWAKD